MVYSDAHADTKTFSIFLDVIVAKLHLIQCCKSVLSISNRHLKVRFRALEDAINYQKYLD